ncbi:hypothetical protein GHT06_008944 [Daphnia sinensis]|uniref:Uncharacterized protein n=1 Tax=Daphnia sinensis TaxID=1820382 RepID=A0AAD5Q125_9CRUS|nr:hypothetical protein GHT06_008944 [Daphnia sinensis]
MLKSMLDLKLSSCATIGELQRTDISFTAEQWDLIMEGIVKVLCPCKQVSREFSSQLGGGGLLIFRNRLIMNIEHRFHNLEHTNPDFRAPK